MADLGQFALRLGLFLSAYAILVDLLGSWRRHRELRASGRNATLGCLLCLTVATGALWGLLVQGNFAVAYVAEHTSRALPLVYKLTALWAGAAGSLLLWLWLQTGFVAAAFSKSDPDSGRFCAVARAAANLVAVFFFLVLIFDKDPFGLSTTIPRDGMGLNPLLQHPAMVLHPPTLFVGYAALVIPYAWTLAALRGGDPSTLPVLLNRARNWSVFGWMFLTLGIGLGAWWAYEELGWGGYWAWDPVENSSLMPWLTAVALLHCGRTYRAGAKTATWFMILAVVTFSLCIFGTFLTRYGLVSSVHAFPEPGLGLLFLVALLFIWVITGALFLVRSDAGRRFRGMGTLPMSSTAVPAVSATGILPAEIPETHGRDAHATHGQDARATRCSYEHTTNAPVQGRGLRVILWNNWLMLLLTFVIFVGTLFPFFSGLVSERTISLKSEYFTKITAPVGLVLLLLLGVCPHLMRHGLDRSWRTVGAIVTGIACVLIWVLAGHLAAAYLVACAFVGLNLAADFVQRYVRRRKHAQRQAPAPRLRWYGARIVHIGVLLTFVGIAGSGGFDVEKQVALRPGERIQVGRFELTYHDLTASHGANFTAVSAEVSVHKGQEQIGKLSPSLAFYEQSGKRTSEVDIRRTLAGDLYLALTNVDSASRLINLTIFIKPLINWIWIGSALMVLGTVLVLAAGRGEGILPARVEGVPPSNRGLEALDTRGRDARDTRPDSPRDTRAGGSPTHSFALGTPGCPHLDPGRQSTVPGGTVEE